MSAWSPEKAREWYRSIPYPFGCNFLPSTAVNSTEMWQAESFDAETIDRELRLARGLGYNSVRVFLPYIVWDTDPEGFIDRMDRFLEIAHGSGITMMPVLFDDCAFAGREPYLGKQADPVPGVHNSGWTSSPGFEQADDPAVRPRLERYVKDIVSAFGRDPRVLIWDLYNEPGNGGRFGKSRSLLEAAFAWAREADPIQPLTAGAWNWDGRMAPVSRVCEEMSDIVSFHCYGDLSSTADLADTLSRYGRPLVCTEWLHRPMGSRFGTHLPFFRERNIAVYNWGLVNGRTQTNLSWETMSGTPDPDPEVWQHDVMYPDGRLYDPAEAAVIRAVTGEDLVLEPVDMTPETMSYLEERNLIIRLRPGAHELDALEGETLDLPIYESAEEFGPHKLIAVTVNREGFAGFATHPDNEEFLLIGDPNTKPMYLAVALCMREDFEEKVRTGSLHPEDLVLLRCRYNDPQVSFFVMMKDVPHGETVTEADLPPASFYVTESRDLPLDLVEMRKYRLKVAPA